MGKSFWCVGVGSCEVLRSLNSSSERCVVSNQHTRNISEENIQVEGCNALILKAPKKRFSFLALSFDDGVRAFSSCQCIFHRYIISLSLAVRWTFELSSRFLFVPLKYHWYWNKFTDARVLAELRFGFYFPYASHHSGRENVAREIRVPK